MLGGRVGRWLRGGWVGGLGGRRRCGGGVLEAGLGVPLLFDGDETLSWFGGREVRD